MKTVKQFTWEIVLLNTPLLKKKCNKCDSKLYYCSNKFRLNSQKKNIDVWLIYRCVKCDTTYNVTILSRTKPELIDKNLYRNFLINDKKTAWKYAFDSEIIRKNQLEVDYESADYDVIKEDALLNDMLDMQEGIFEFKIKTELNFNIKLSHVLRKCFKISSGELDKMLSAGVVIVQPEGNIKKYKIKNGVTITVCKEKLRVYTNSKVST